jgi:hypothetical protein
MRAFWGILPLRPVVHFHNAVFFLPERVQLAFPSPFFFLPEACHV